MAEAEKYIDINGVCKYFGVVHALEDISFTIRKGEIHTLLGENGAGKSTLVKIIMGEQPPTKGTISIDGEVIREYNPIAAQHMGIQMVHQELAIFENMTVAENMFPQLSEDGKRRINWKELNRKTQEALDLFDIKTIKPTQKMGTVPLAGQQMIEILRCIQAQPKVLLLDEPTSGLNDEESSRLMEILHQLKADGLTIIYISHRLNEILEVTDRISVLRDGHYVGTFDNIDIDENVLIDQMVGHELSGKLYKHKEYMEPDRSEILFEVEHLSKRHALEDSSFSLYKNEVLGFFGLEGSGCNKLSRMMFGLESKDTGTVRVKGKEIKKLNPTEMIENGVMYLNNNRKEAGLLLNMSVTDNMTLPLLEMISNKLSFIDTRKRDSQVNANIEKFSIVTASSATTVGSLSGGNQQKVMLGMCSVTDPDIIIVNEPTRGIDVGVKAQIHEYLMDCARMGIGIIVISSEMPELMTMCDRIIIMNNQKIAGEISGAEISEASIMQLAAVDA